MKSLDYLTHLMTLTTKQLRLLGEEDDEVGTRELILREVITHSAMLPRFLDHFPGYNPEKEVALLIKVLTDEIDFKLENDKRFDLNLQIMRESLKQIALLNTKIKEHDPKKVIQYETALDEIIKKLETMTLMGYMVKPYLNEPEETQLQALNSACTPIEGLPNTYAIIRKLIQGFSLQDIKAIDALSEIASSPTSESVIDLLLEYQKNEFRAVNKIQRLALKVFRIEIDEIITQFEQHHPPTIQRINTLLLGLMTEEWSDIKPLHYLFFKTQHKTALAKLLVEQLKTYVNNDKIASYDAYQFSKRFKKTHDTIQLLEQYLPCSDVKKLVKEAQLVLPRIPSHPSLDHIAEMTNQYIDIYTNERAFRHLTQKDLITLSAYDLLEKNQTEDYEYCPSGDRLRAVVFDTLWQNALKDYPHDVDLSTLNHKTPYPLLLQVVLHTLSPSITKSFERFFQKLSSVNEHASTQHKKDPELLLIRYTTAIIQLIQVMGEDAIKLLSDLVANTLLPLERYLENVSGLSPRYLDALPHYYARHRKLIKKNKIESQAFDNLLIILPLLSELTYSADEDIETIETQMTALLETGEPSDVNSLLLRRLLTIMMDGFHFPIPLDKIDLDTLFSRLSKEHFLKLAQASIKMRQSKYKDVFQHLLYLDLTGGDIDHFLHNMEQDNPLGVELATHNHEVQESLKTSGIDPAMALHYPKTLDVVIYQGEGSQNKKENALLVEWHYILKLKPFLIKELEKASNLKTQQQLTSVLKQINSLHDEVDTWADLTKKMTHLSKDINLQKLTKAYKNLIALKKQAASFDSKFNEFSDHVIAQHKLMSSLGKKHIDTDTRPAVFQIEQWSKEKTLTSFLGDEVGCCLGTNGFQFQALVQRRQDDAMLFHVAVDQKTGRPAALIWLYLAKTTDGKIVLVANFFEVNTKYALNDETRQALLHALLQFTHQYCQDNPKIENFYMNVLEYGWNMTDLDDYPVVELDIEDKVGGAFIPSDLLDEDEGEDDLDSKREITAHFYYLASLEKKDKQFYKFSPIILDKISPLNLYTLNQLIKSSVQNAFETLPYPTVPLVEQYVIEQHGVELQLALHEPLLDSARFNQLIRDAYRIEKRETISLSQFSTGKDTLLGCLNAPTEEATLTKTDTSSKGLSDTFCSMM